MAQPALCSPDDTHHQDNEEEVHLYNVCFAFSNYAVDCNFDITRIQRNFEILSNDDKELLLESTQNRIQKLRTAVTANQLFLNHLIPNEAAEMDENRESTTPTFLPPDSPATMERNISKVRSTLRQFVRDWSVEGKEERDGCYQPLLESLDKYLPVVPSQKRFKVLVPGSGLARLQYEIMCKGYSTQGNEFSYFMLFGSNFILNTILNKECFSIYPYALCTCNLKGFGDNLQEIRIPDVTPWAVLEEEEEKEKQALLNGEVYEPIDFSMCAGEFVEVYSTGENNKAWDGIVTCFFIDTAKNIIQYVRTIAYLLREGGYWFNLGPLLYHFAESAGEPSIELSWEELRLIILRWFHIEEERQIDCHYTTNKLTLMQMQYHSIFFVAKRNNNPITGSSNTC